MDVGGRTAAPRGRGGRRKGSGKRAAGDAPWELRAIQALADASRWDIVHLLSIHEDTVGEVARRVGLSIACTSRHMSILIESELVESRRAGRTTRCRLAVPGSRAGGLLHALGIETLDGLVSGPALTPTLAPAGESATIPEFEPSRLTIRRYQSKDMDDFLL